MPIDLNGTGEVDPYIMSGGAKSDMKAVWVMQDGSKTQIWPAYQNVIDNFEDNDLTEYTFSDTSGSAATWTNGFPNDVPGGEETSVKLDGYKRLFSLADSYDNPGGDGFANYPDWGMTWEFYFRPVTFYNTPSFLRCNFNMGDYNTDNCYRIEWESDPTPGANMSLERRKDAVNEIVKVTPEGTGVRTQTTYRCVVHMVLKDTNGDGLDDGVITAEWWNHETNTKIDELTLTDTDPTYLNGIGWETNGYMEAGFDVARIIS